MPEIKINSEIRQIVSVEQAWHYRIIPESIEKEKLVFYADEQKISKQLTDELEIVFDRYIQLLPKSNDTITKALNVYYRNNSTADRDTLKINFQNDFVKEIIEEAYNLKCSDIHIESFEETARIRIRIDGKLIERYTIKKEDYPSFINKIKILSNLDIAEKRLPQDGRIYFEVNKTKFDIRVSILPTLYGEKAVLRLLSKDAAQIDINELGFDQKQLSDYLNGINKTHGIVLISGPTGSGKTTTLYATLKILNTEETNIITIEDPIEYTLEGINQVQLKEQIGLTFPKALRTFLRQDPDIIMLGEIRDPETAEMAVRASLTGHMVLSTIHTNSAWGTITRLMDMGVPEFLISSTINLSVAQRLVRLVCPECNHEEKFDHRNQTRQFEALKHITEQRVAHGCAHCYFTGYKGRKAVYEVIPIDYELSESIRNRKVDVSALIRSRGIKSLADSAIDLFKNGKTTFEEIYPILLDSNL